MIQLVSDEDIIKKEVLLKKYVTVFIQKNNCSVLRTNVYACMSSAYVNQPSLTKNMQIKSLKKINKKFYILFLTALPDTCRP